MPRNTILSVPLGFKLKENKLETSQHIFNHQRDRQYEFSRSIINYSQSSTVDVLRYAI